MDAVGGAPPKLTAPARRAATSQKLPRLPETLPGLSTVDSPFLVTYRFGPRWQGGVRICRSRLRPSRFEMCSADSRRPCRQAVGAAVAQ